MGTIKMYIAIFWLIATIIFIVFPLVVKFIFAFSTSNKGILELTPTRGSATNADNEILYRSKRSVSLIIIYSLIFFIFSLTVPSAFYALVFRGASGFSLRLEAILVLPILFFWYHSIMFLIRSHDTLEIDCQCIAVINPYRMYAPYIIKRSQIVQYVPHGGRRGSSRLYYQIDGKIKLLRVLSEGNSSKFFSALYASCE